MNIIKIKKINKRNDISTERFTSFDCPELVKESKGNVVSLIKETTKTVNVENIEDIEEYLNIKETTSHVKINKKLN